MRLVPVNWVCNGLMVACFYKRAWCLKPAVVLRLATKFGLRSDFINLFGRVGSD